MSGEVPKGYFLALADSEADGEALYNIHQSRAAWARSSGQVHGMPQVDGGM